MQLDLNHRELKLLHMSIASRRQSLDQLIAFALRGCELGKVTFLGEVLVELNTLDEKLHAAFMSEEMPVGDGPGQTEPTGTRNELPIQPSDNVAHTGWMGTEGTGSPPTPEP